MQYPLLRERSRCRLQLSSAVLVLILSGVGLPGRLLAVTLYDVDFEAPVHTAGQAQTLGQGPAPRKTATSFLNPYTPPIVVNQPGMLDGQSLYFGPGSGTYRQVEFGIGNTDGGFAEQYPFYRFHMDVLLRDSSSSSDYKVLFDGPVANQLDFVSGRIHAVTLGSTGYDRQIGSVYPGQRMAFDVSVDRTHQWWYIRLNGAAVLHGAYPTYPGIGGMRSLRFSLDGNAEYYADNVRVEGLPEPATLGLAALGAIMLRLRQRRRGQEEAGRR